MIIILIDTSSAAWHDDPISEAGFVLVQVQDEIANGSREQGRRTLLDSNGYTTGYVEVLLHPR